MIEEIPIPMVDFQRIKQSSLASPDREFIKIKVEAAYRCLYLSASFFPNQEADFPPAEFY